VDIFGNEFVSNVSFVVMMVMLLLGNPLPFRVHDTINWISNLYSSPWLWKNTRIIRSKSMDSFFDIFLTNISVFMVMVVLS